MESQGHGATPLTVTRGGSFAQHRFVHQLAGHHRQHYHQAMVEGIMVELHPQDLMVEQHPQEIMVEQHPQEIIGEYHHQEHHRQQQAMTMAPNGATAEAKRGPLPSGKA